MIDRTVNLTHLCLIKEIHQAIAQTTNYRLRTMLQNPIYERRLIDYVLSNINHRYLLLKNITVIPKEASELLPQCPITEQLEIRQLLQMVIKIIVTELLKQTKESNIAV